MALQTLRERIEPYRVPSTKCVACRQKIGVATRRNGLWQKTQGKNQNNQSQHHATREAKLTHALTHGIRPVIGRFIETHPLKAQLISIGIDISRIKNTKGLRRKILRSRHDIQHHRLVPGQGSEKCHYCRIPPIHQESMVPTIDQHFIGNAFDSGKIHHHALLGDALKADNLPGKGNFERVAVAVQVTALAVVIGDTVAGIELQPAGNQHIEMRSKNERELYHSSLPEAAFSGSIRVMTDKKTPLTTTDHSRNSAGLTYVYPVVSRRAGGVSVGININTNNACNWRCIYCQVPNLQRGSAPPVNLPLLEKELREFLGELQHGSFMRESVPPEARRLNDIALSGNGEPTSAAEFEQVIELIGRVMDEFSLSGRIKLVLITNGSLIHRPTVRNGIKKMARLNGEIWFKLDSVTAQGRIRINHSRQSTETVLKNLRVAAGLCPTWIQTATFALDGQPTSPGERQAYMEFLARCQDEGIPLQGVLLYDLARPSLQPEAPRLSKSPSAWIEAFASEIRQLGLAVKLST